MSSEAITRNDLTAILNEVLPPTPSEYKKLLWTNPSPTSAMSGSTTIVASGADEYDAIEVEYKLAHIYDGYETASAPFVSGAHITLFAPAGTVGEFTGNIYNAVRTISMGVGGVLTVDSAVGMTSSGTTSNNNMCIPYKVYGIKYDRVAPPQLAIPTIAHNENFVGSSGTINKTYTATDAGIYIILARSNAYSGSSVPEIRISVNNTRIAQNADAGGSVMTYLATTLSAGDVVKVEYTASNGGAEGDWCNLTIIQLA